MAFISNKFKEAMEEAGLTHSQQETVIEALAKEPNIIAAVTMLAMDRNDRRASRA